MKKSIKSILVSSGVVIAVALYLFIAANTVIAADQVLKVGATAGVNVK